MDMKIYKKTRYQNIYQHIKNKNYAVMLSKPIKTSISRIDDRIITDINDAIRIRDSYFNSPKIAQKKATINDFYYLWDKYIDWCKCIKKMAYNTLEHKRKDFNCFFKDKINKPFSKLDRNFWAKFIDDLETTDKQKNQAIKQLTAFYNWCIDEQHCLYNPISKISRYKVLKPKMKYWTPEEIKAFFDTLEKDLNSKELKVLKKANLVFVLVNISLATGNRIGESRALTFNSFDSANKKVDINHSINYDRKSTNFFSETKTYESQRSNYVTDRLINIVFNYKNFLENLLDYEISNESLIFFNHFNKKPYTDTTLRKHFDFYCKKACVPIIRLYDLRHTFATNLVAEGIPVPYVQEMLGHTSYNTTVKNYVHTRKDIKITTSEMADKLLQR